MRKARSKLWSRRKRRKLSRRQKQRQMYSRRPEAKQQAVKGQPLGRKFCRVFYSWPRFVHCLSILHVRLLPPPPPLNLYSNALATHLRLVFVILQPTRVQEEQEPSRTPTAPQRPPLAARLHRHPLGAGGRGPLGSGTGARGRGRRFRGRQAAAVPGGQDFPECFALLERREAAWYRRRAFSSSSSERLFFLW